MDNKEESGRSGIRPYRLWGNRRSNLSDGNRANFIATPQNGLFSSGVPRLWSFAKYWLPVILWMTLIFSASADSKSGQRSSRIIAPLLRWLKADISDAAVDRIVFVVRKTAHLTEFALLAGLIWRARRKPVKNDPRPWQWTDAAFAVGMSALYSASDELHQLFVPTREGRFGDVLLDTVGALCGLLVIWILGRWRKCW
jgi:VanZ family protein